MEKGITTVKKTKKPNACRFLFACMLGECAKIADYIELGGDINVTSTVTKKSGLIYALENKKYTAASLLIHCGIDLTLKDKKNKTAMDYADDVFKELMQQEVAYRNKVKG